MHFTKEFAQKYIGKIDISVFCVFSFIFFDTHILPYFMTFISYGICHNLLYHLSTWYRAKVDKWYSGLWHIPYVNLSPIPDLILRPSGKTQKSYWVCRERRTNYIFNCYIIFVRLKCRLSCFLYWHLEQHPGQGQPWPGCCPRTFIDI